MTGSTFVIVLALVTLGAFLAGGAFERWVVRRAWQKGERTTMGRREEERRLEENV